jgi:hypothetical protein
MTILFYFILFFPIYENFIVFYFIPIDENFILFCFIPIDDNFILFYFIFSNIWEFYCILFYSNRWEFYFIPIDENFILFYFIPIDENFIMFLKGADPATTKTTLLCPTIRRSRISLCYLKRNLTTSSYSTADKPDGSRIKGLVNTQDTIHQLCT